MSNANAEANALDFTRESCFMKAPYRFVVAAGIGMLLRAPSASAQVLRSVAMDATIGTAEGRGGDFVDRNFAAAHFAVSGVVPVAPKVGFFIALGYDWFGFFAAGHGDTCRINPGSPSGCVPKFPTVGGSNLTLGGTFALASAVQLRAGLGAGAYSFDDTRIGAALAEAEAAVFPVPYLGIVARARTVAIPRYRQDRLSLAHWLLGVRLRPSASRS